MATALNFSPVRQASRANDSRDKRPDESVSPEGLVKKRYETLCRLSGSLVLGTPQDWIRHLRADLESDGACVVLHDPEGGQLHVYAFDFPVGTEIFQKGTAIAFE